LTLLILILLMLIFFFLVPYANVAYSCIHRAMKIVCLHVCTSLLHVWIKWQCLETSPWYSSCWSHAESWILFVTYFLFPSILPVIFRKIYLGLYNMYSKNIFRYLIISNNYRLYKEQYLFIGNIFYSRNF